MASLWQTLLHPDLDDNPDRSLITSAANILEIGEFQLLQLAFHSWFDRDMNNAEQSQYFTSYSMKGEVQPWMRHYARHIIDSDQQGEIDCADPKFHIYDADPEYKRLPSIYRFTGAAVFLVSVMVVLILLADVIVDGGGSVFPPYFENKQ